MSEITVPQRFTRKMAGIEPLPSLSESQIAAIASGPTLRIEAVASKTRGARPYSGDAVMEGSHRLGKSCSLALPPLIQVGSQRSFELKTLI